jgi:hypothetical protein
MFWALYGVQMSSPTRTRRELLGAAGATVFGAVTTGQAVAASGTAPTFVVQAFEPIGIEVDRGETYDASATILNAGRPGTATVEYRIEDETVRSREITLDRSEERKVTFESIETASLEPGELTHGVYSAGYSRRGSIRISGTPAFEVSEIRPRLGDTEVGSQFSVTATITNTGEGDGEQAVELLIDGESRDSEAVSLDVGESQAVTFTVDSPEAAGEYTHTVCTEDDDVSGAISVVGQGSGADGGSGRELLFAVGGGGSVAALYGAYRLFARRRDRDRIGDDDPKQTGGDDSTLTGGAGGGSAVLESVIDDNLDSAGAAVSGARRHRSQGEYARALAACYRARTALDDAAEAASEYDTDRVAEIDSQIETVDDLATAIEAELDD